jgi:hypothetical protein
LLEVSHVTLCLVCVGFSFWFAWNCELYLEEIVE